MSFKPNHLPELDGLRAIAILMVLAAHFKEPTPHWLWQPLNQGGFGVYLFFVLSGFLITRILLYDKNGPSYFRNFYARRTLRIFPLYYGVLALHFWVLLKLYPTPGTLAQAPYQGWLWGYAYNVLMAIKGHPFFSSDWMGLGHFWTLAVEEQFYLVWPFLVLFLSKKTLMKSCIAIILLTPILRLSFHAAGANDYWYRVFTFCQLDSLALGSLLACLESSQKLVVLKKPAAWMMTGIGAILFMATMHWPQSPEYGIPLIAYHGAVALFFAAFVALAACGSFRWLKNAILVEIGHKSYAMYVFHVPLLFLAMNYIMLPARLRHGFGHSIPADIAFFIIMTAATYAVAFISYHAYEKHFLKLKRFFGRTTYDVPREQIQPQVKDLNTTAGQAQLQHSNSITGLSMPKVSIIVPTFNSGKTIEKCLRSIGQQSFADYEIVIQDGGSSDTTLKLINDFQTSNPAIKINVESKRDKGIYDAMNLGMARATGEWIFFLGSDDELYDENVLKTVMSAAGTDAFKVLYGNVKIIGDPGWAKDGEVYDGQFTLEKLFQKNICHQAIFYRLDLARQVGEYNRDYIVCADWDFTLRCRAKTDFKFVDVIVAKFHAGGNSSTKLTDPKFCADIAANVVRYFNLSIYDPLVNRPTFWAYGDIQKMQQAKPSIRLLLGRIYRGVGRRLGVVRGG
jgi:peptidoglycan/LPS O-acetylase OafA/YrhL/glycosyltransferase involved in cell wall biosynthesis